MTESKRGGKRPGSGRKKGVPNKATIDLKGKAGEYTAEAIQVFVDVMRDTNAPAAVRVNAADKLLDRSHGRPAIYVDAQVSGKMDADMLKRIETEMVERMALARERQRAVLIERGILNDDK
ncbi:hypothetical protein [Methylobacter sp.]|uniref:hypothetical protein n=1 Tax=Methylobacter sp. TaxID=2051955 RepID=UPI002FDE64D5